MIPINIDGYEIQGSKGQTILEAARAHGIDIPTLCHHEWVEPSASCGLCVVEQEGNQRLLRSCATEIQPGMILHTQSPRVRASRRLTLELLLSDHQGDCRPPCVEACPAHTDCQGYIGLIANGEYAEALKLIRERIPLPVSIGLVCPHPCEEVCRRHLVEEPIAIAALKVFAAEMGADHSEAVIPPIPEDTGQRVAIVGSGPAGLTVAYFLRLQGHGVSIYEAMPEAGGMLRYGIPDYRLPAAVLDREIQDIERMGVEIHTGVRINQDIDLDYLRKNFDAVFLGIGAWRSSRIRCQGEDAEGVIGGIEFLRAVALKEEIKMGKRVAVIGGGNTAMDAARTAVRMGAEEVMVLYRRTRAQMPAEESEIREAEEEGVVFRFLLAPEEIISSGGHVSAIRMQKMQLGEPDASGRRRPIPIVGEEETIPVDTVIAAIGQQVQMDSFPEIRASQWHTIDIEEGSYMTNLPGVFAGGDAVSGPGIAIEAIAQGQEAAQLIHSFLQGKVEAVQHPYQKKRHDLNEESFADFPRQSRVYIPCRPPELRKKDFMPVSGRMTEEQAKREAGRCLECGCQDYFECRLIHYAGEYGVDPSDLKGELHPEVPHDDHPYIMRDAAKCILCGLCVTVCDEIVGAAALGLVRRGFNTVIQPEFGLPLQESPCIACGQCIAVCPTGALMEKAAAGKNTPLRLDETHSSCSFCSLACQEIIASKGQTIFRVRPERNSLLCAQGKWNFQLFDQERLYKPLLRRNGQLLESSWEDAYQEISQRVHALREKHPAAAIFCSAAATSETAEKLAVLAQKHLGTFNLSSFYKNSYRGVHEILGADYQPLHLEAINHSDLILMAGSFQNSAVIPMKIRAAVKQGARLIVLSQAETLVDDLAAIRCCPDKNGITLLQEINAFILQHTAGVETDLGPGNQAVEIAQQYLQARKAIMVIDGAEFSDDAIQELARMVFLTGKDQAAGESLLLVDPGVNALGVWRAGFQMPADQLEQYLHQAEESILFIHDQDPVGTGEISAEELQQYSLVLVTSAVMNETVKLADVVLPIPAPIEETGTYSNAEGRAVRLEAIRPPAAGKTSVEILDDLMMKISPLHPGEKTERAPGYTESYQPDQD